MLLSIPPSLTVQLSGRKSRRPTITGTLSGVDGIWADCRLASLLDHGLDAVEAACAEALEAGIASGDVILTVLARQWQPAVPASITTPAALRLNSEPMADCGRYDSIRILA